MNNTTTIRPPVVAVMGHIDHGKSTLLDYIRSANVTAGEAGGITQHLSAYQISIPYQGTERGITFLDTPGHAAFTGMRERGAIAADIAILVVSAEDGVKAQTIEALNTIRNAKIPFIVAINKIDRPGANIEKAKQMLAEQEVLVEGYGGDIPWNAISAKVGTGIPELLETILLVADLEELQATPSKNAEGIIIESKLDKQRGITATLMVKDGTLKKSQFVVAGTAITTTRIMENFLGKTIAEAGPSTPVQLVGFDEMPSVGVPVVVFDKKRDAENYIEEQTATVKTADARTKDGEKVVPIIIKTDVYGTAEAVEREIKKMNVEGLHIRIITKAVGNIGEADIKHAQGDKDTIILGFNVIIDKSAHDIQEKVQATVQTFDIIYKLTEWLEVELEKRRPRIETREVIGTAKVLKTFSKTKERQVLGCRVESGSITDGAKVSVIRREFNLTTGTVVELQQAKQKVREVTDGECGILVECKNDIAPGDILEAFIYVTK
ncbi:MAG: infB [Candidatus Nomurabacteria bacterium]|nr:infB [Candidatus Nomurabacteria bacterium]